VICENDEFEYDRGEVKHHRVNLREPRGAMYAAYVIVRMKDGGEKSEVMGRDEIEAIRKRSRSGNNGPWTTDYNEMAKKTVFRRASKWLSLSSDFRDALEADDEHAPIVMSGADFAQIPTDAEQPRRMRLRGQADTPPNPPADDTPIDPPASDDVSQIDPDASYVGDEQ
jgi:recombination protein RecT